MSDECMCRFDEEDGDCLLYYHCPEGYRLLNAGDRSRFAQHIVTAVRRLDAEREERAPSLGTCDEEFAKWRLVHRNQLFAQDGWDGCWNLYHPPEPDPCDAAWKAYRDHVLRGGDIPATHTEAAFRAGWEARS